MGLVVYTQDARVAYQNGTVEIAFGGRPQHAEKDEAFPLVGELGHPRGGCPIGRFDGMPAVGIHVSCESLREEDQFRAVFGDGAPRLKACVFDIFLPPSGHEMRLNDGNSHLPSDTAVRPAGASRLQVNTRVSVAIVSS
jgi:hypothetical protein